MAAGDSTITLELTPGLLPGYAPVDFRRSICGAKNNLLKLAVDIRTGLGVPPSRKRPGGRPRDTWLKPFKRLGGSILEQWNCACTHHGLKPNPEPWCRSPPPNGSLTIGGIVVESVDEFVYLGSLQSGCAGSEAVDRDSGRNHETSQQYLAEWQDKNGHQGENIIKKTRI